MKTQSYSNFWQEIHNSAKTEGFPLRVMFELTYKCNFSCKHCYVPENYRKKRELKTREVFLILEQLKELGCFYLGFTGGEPFTRKDILEILLYAKRCGFQVIIYTNGSLLDKKIVDALARLRTNKVDITIPAMSKSAFERISGVANSRDKVFRAIDLLYKKGVNLGFKTCVLKENENEIKDIRDFTRSLGALHRLDTMLSRRLNGSSEPYKYRGRLKENLDAGCQILDTSKVNLKEHERESNIENRTSKIKDLFRCGVGVSQAAITPQGELKMCLMIDYPKYKILNSHFVPRLSSLVHRKEGLKEAWEELKSLVSTIKPDKNYQCYKCELKAYCKWCPGRGWLHQRNFTACDPDYRTWAESRYRITQMGARKDIG
ncbi:MAG: radical SAM protein [Candidatus Omnitrophota bacterium]